jgi:capsular exopolysaccharide synthesis family protein
VNLPLLESNTDTPNNGLSPPEGGMQQLPFDILTVAKGVWKWRVWILSWFVLCGGAGAAMSVVFAPRIWQTEAVLSYRPPSEELLGGMYEPPSIKTLLNMVKIKKNLAETRLRLKLAASLEQIGAACRIEIPKDSQLLVFQVKWNSPEDAAPIANTLAQVFIAEQHKMRRLELSNIISDVEKRLDNVELKIRNSGASEQMQRESQTRQQNIVQFRNRIESVGQENDATLAEKRGLERQIAELNSQIEEEKEKLAHDRAEAAKSEPPSVTNMRIERLSNAINEDKQQRINEIDKAEWETRLKNSRRLHGRGFMSDAQLAAHEAQYKKFLAATEDSERARKLRDDRDAAMNRLAANGSNSIQTSVKLRELESNLGRIKLNLTGLLEKLSAQQVRRRELEKELYRLMDFQPPPNSIDPRLLSEWHKEADGLRDTLAGLEAIVSSNSPDFTFVSNAVPTTVPAKSYRKIFCVLIAGMGAVVGFAALVGWELMDTTVKSRAEVSLKLDQQVLGLLPDVQKDSNVLPEGWESCLIEPIRAVVRRIRASVPQRGARFFIVSAGIDEGCTTVTAHLAKSFGQQGEEVVLVDGDVRQSKPTGDVREIVVAQQQEMKGLGDYLSGSAASLTDVKWPTTLYGVTCVPRAQHGVVPELLSSRRMFDLLDSLSQQYDVVLVDGPPAASNADAEILAAQADAIIFVVQSRRFRSSEVKKVVERLTATGVPVLGVVLNRVEPLFLDSEWT